MAVATVALALLLALGAAQAGGPLGLSGLGLYGAPLGLGLYGAPAGLGLYGARAGLGLYGAPAGLGLYGTHGLIGAPALYGAPLGSGAIISNPGGLSAAAVPGVNIGVDGAGPSTGSLLVGPTAVLHGSSATLIANTGAVKGHANAGSNLPSIGGAVAPSSLGYNIPASAQAILRPGPLALL